MDQKKKENSIHPLLRSRRVGLLRRPRRSASVILEFEFSASPRRSRSRTGRFDRLPATLCRHRRLARPQNLHELQAGGHDGSPAQVTTPEPAGSGRYENLRSPLKQQRPKGSGNQSIPSTPLIGRSFFSTETSPTQSLPSAISLMVLE